MTRLSGKTALITGAGSGLGRAQALLFASAGARVVVADIEVEAAAQVASEIKKAGGSALSVSMDVTDETSVRLAVDRAIERFGRIHILSNTAGAWDGKAQTLDTSRALWDRIVAVNLTSLYIVTNAVLGHMIEQGGGVVLSISSGAGLRGGGGGAAYTSTKHAVVGYTRQLAAGYGSLGIRANAIAPGLIETPMTAAFSSDEALQSVLRSKPAGRIGQPEDVARAALFLVSDEANYIHGVTLPVDGGVTETL